MPNSLRPSRVETLYLPWMELVLSARRAGKAAQRSTRAGDDIQDTDLDIVLAMDDQVWEATNAPMPHSSSA
jgi:hypothetical protein